MSISHRLVAVFSGSLKVAVGYAETRSGYPSLSYALTNLAYQKLIGVLSSLTFALNSNNFYL